MRKVYFTYTPADCLGTILSSSFSHISFRDSKSAATESGSFIDAIVFAMSEIMNTLMNTLVWGKKG